MLCLRSRKHSTILAGFKRLLCSANGPMADYDLQTRVVAHFLRLLALLLDRGRLDDYHPSYAGHASSLSASLPE